MLVEIWDLISAYPFFTGVLLGSLLPSDKAKVTFGLLFIIVPTCVAPIAHSIMYENDLNDFSAFIVGFWISSGISSGTESWKGVFTIAGIFKNGVFTIVGIFMNGVFTMIGFFISFFIYNSDAGFLSHAICVILGHTFEKFIYIESNSCKRIRKCSRCNEQEVQSFVNHEYGEWQYVESNSCKRIRKCVRCNEQEVESPVNHEYGELQEIEGNYYELIRYCVRCNKEKREDYHRCPNCGCTSFYEDWSDAYAETAYLSRPRDVCSNCGK